MNHPPSPRDQSTPASKPISVDRESVERFLEKCPFVIRGIGKGLMNLLGLRTDKSKQSRNVLRKRNTRENTANRCFQRLPPLGEEAVHGNENGETGANIPRSESEQREDALRSPSTQDEDTITPADITYHIPTRLSPVPEQDSPVKTKNVHRPFSPTPRKASQGYSIGDVDAITPAPLPTVYKPSLLSPVQEQETSIKTYDSESSSSQSTPNRASRLRRAGGGGHISPVKPSLTSSPPLPESPGKGNAGEEKVEEVDNVGTQVSTGPGAYNVDTIRGDPRKSFVMERRSVFEAMSAGGEREQGDSAVATRGISKIFRPGTS